MPHTIPTLSALLHSYTSCTEIRTHWHGVDEATRSLLLGVGVERAEDRDVLIICENEKRMRILERQFLARDGQHTVLTFPNNELIPFEVLAQSDEIAVQRAAVLNRLVQAHDPLLILTTGTALTPALLQRETYTARCLSLQVGDILDFNALRRHLTENRYRMERVVTQPGEASIHGGIVDVFAPGSAYPVRIEFFDDEVDSLRYFDPQSQRSTGSCEAYVIPPAREFFVPEDQVGQAADRLEKAKKAYVKHLKGNHLLTEAAEIEGRINALVADMRAGIENDNLALYGAYFGLEPASLTTYFAPDACIYIDEINRVEDALYARVEERKDHFQGLQKNGLVMPRQWDYYLTPEAIGADFSKHRTTYFSLLKRTGRWWQADVPKPFPSETLPSQHGRFELAISQLRHWMSRGYRLLCLHDKAENRRLFRDLCDSYDLPLQSSANLTEGTPGLYILEAPPEEGAVFIEDKVVVLSCDFMQSPQPKASRRGKKEEEGDRIASPDELEKGDYVVHESHGIGLYQGIVHMKTGEIERDYLLIQYAGTDKLYVPVDQFDLLQRYSRHENHRPRLNKLSSNEWQRVKKRVRASVRELAESLLQIYAKRQSLPGFAFSPDTALQHEFEERFPYVETEDQLRAIQDVKADMESSAPMDRLICGDVGYGKTEVAIRAAFKAVCDGKQVAVLVPTTILAQQHEETFRRRFKPFAVTVRSLSRFTPAKEQREILRDLKDHKIDILIGTHKLLNKSVSYADLGLLVIDEEQRFGVTHKERIKAIRSQVDVMTLTATPIPRTLHMSLTGIRDVSLIETPPEDRYPIQTYVVENQPIILEQAIRRELSREGQVFVVYNRIEDMDRVVRTYQKMVPEARILTAHGRMTEHNLEDVILAFLRREADILISTTIIETGIDMPNVNTMIVLDADRMGLSQLYQLRGRIGRSSRVAYAYLTYARDKTMTPLAERRLQTLKEYTALGSGYRIALKDLELRGAGTLLGAEQSGNVMDVGFDIYMHLLQEAIEEVKGIETAPKRSKPEIELTISAFIPESYISDSVLRLQVYQRLERCRNEAELGELLDELIDRFGDIPEEVLQLLHTIEIRLMASELGFRSIKQMQHLVYLAFLPDANHDMPVLLRLTEKFPKRLKLSNRSGELVMIWDAQKEHLDQTSLDSIKLMLQTFINDCNPEAKTV